MGRPRRSKWFNERKIAIGEKGIGYMRRTAILEGIVRFFRGECAPVEQKKKTQKTKMQIKIHIK